MPLFVLWKLKKSQCLSIQICTMIKKRLEGEVNLYLSESERNCHCLSRPDMTWFISLWP